jgi:transposase-like protein
MRKCRQYSNEFKEKLLAKVFSPNAPSVIELARRAGIPYHTLTTWIYMSKKKPMQSNGTTSVHPKDKSAEAKLQAISDTLKMTEAEKSAYCRKHGFYMHELDEWKTQMLSGVNSPREQKSENRQYIAEIKQLKKELNRKEKALAETSALLVLKKKANLIWGDGEED